MPVLCFPWLAAAGIPHLAGDTQVNFIKSDALSCVALMFRNPIDMFLG